MPLINCPACSREVSDQAKSCPQCGHPITLQITPAHIPEPEPQPVYQQPQVIEQTGKGYKGLQAFGCVGFLIGIICVCSGNPEMGIVLILCGAILWVGGTLGAWWHHG